MTGYNKYTTVDYCSDSVYEFALHIDNFQYLCCNAIDMDTFQIIHSCTYIILTHSPKFDIILHLLKSVILTALQRHHSITIIVN